MFFNLTPEMIERYNNHKNIRVPTFNEFFNKHYYNEVSDFYKNFKFSFSWKKIMMINNLQNMVRQKIMNDYVNKYPTAIVVEDYTLHKKTTDNEDNVIDSYDIVEHEETSNLDHFDNVETSDIDINVGSNSTTTTSNKEVQQPIALRRSRRLQNRQ